MLSSRVPLPPATAVVGSGRGPSGIHVRAAWSNGSQPQGQGFWCTFFGRAAAGISNTYPRAWKRKARPEQSFHESPALPDASSWPSALKGPLPHPRSQQVLLGQLCHVKATAKPAEVCRVDLAVTVPAGAVPCPSPWVWLCTQVAGMGLSHWGQVALNTCLFSIRVHHFGDVQSTATF